MKVDFHLHSSFSGDSDTAPEQIVVAGLKRGLSGLCFTDHYDADYPYDDVCFELDTATYFTHIAKLQAIYKKRIEIGFGVELGLQPHLGFVYRSYVERFPFDFVIGSTHLVAGEDPYYPTFWEKYTPKVGIQKFLEETIKNIRAFDGFDVYGHLDYIVRYAPQYSRQFSYRDYHDLIDEILKLLIDKGRGLEVNTGGYKAGLGCPNPCPDILVRYKELGGEIVTLGSDAHTAEYVGSYIKETQAILRSCGFRYFTLFRERKARFVPLN